jgi:hypothetical protein
LNSKKRCTGCHAYFPAADLIKINSGRFHSYECASQHGRDKAAKLKARKKADADKSFKRETKCRREALKSRGDYLKEAQTAVNAYIRARDSGKPCVSCDKPDNGQHQRHASHYRSVGACSSMRFNTWNIHASCATCNAVLSGNLIEYRIRLIPKIGAAKVEMLESANDVTRYSIEYLKRLKKVFAKRTKQTQARCDNRE